MNSEHAEQNLPFLLVFLLGALLHSHAYMLIFSLMQWLRHILVKVLSQQWFFQLPTSVQSH